MPAYKRLREVWKMKWLYVTSSSQRGRLVEEMRARDSEVKARLAA